MTPEAEPEAEPRLSRDVAEPETHRHVTVTDKPDTDCVQRRNNKQTSRNNNYEQFTIQPSHETATLYETAIMYEFIDILTNYPGPGCKLTESQITGESTTNFTTNINNYGSWHLGRLRQLVLKL